MNKALLIIPVVALIILMLYLGFRKSDVVGIEDLLKRIDEVKQDL